MGAPLVAVVDTVFPTLDPAKQILSEINATIKMVEEPTPKKILDVAANADGILVTYGKITNEVIEGLKNCKVIGRFGIGIDNIDIRAASEKGITVTYAPVYCLDEVSDHAMSLLLSLARKIPYANKLVTDGRWEMPAVVPVGRLRGKTLGLVGLGNIPQRIVEKAQAFGMEISASDPYCPDNVFKKLGVAKLSFDELLSNSDFVSIHAPLTKETENMFNMDTFIKMKPTSFLINTARGPLVNTIHLAAALDKGEIAGAGLDVLPTEPPKQNDPIVGRKDVIITPHTGFYSEEALLELQTTVATDVLAVLSGKKPEYPVKAT